MCINKVAASVGVGVYARVLVAHVCACVSRQVYHVSSVRLCGLCGPLSRSVSFSVCSVCVEGDRYRGGLPIYIYIIYIPVCIYIYT